MNEECQEKYLLFLINSEVFDYSIILVLTVIYFDFRNYFEK